MTYCVGIKLNAGLVFLSDSRTNAGVDHISTFRKMIVYEQPGELLREDAPVGVGSLQWYIEADAEHYFTLREGGRTEPNSTNLDIYAVPADACEGPGNLTQANRGTDTTPAVACCPSRPR